MALTNWLGGKTALTPAQFLAAKNAARLRLVSQTADPTDPNAPTPPSEPQDDATGASPPPGAQPSADPLDTATASLPLASGPAGPGPGTGMFGLRQYTSVQGTPDSNPPVLPQPSDAPTQPQGWLGRINRAIQSPQASIFADAATNAAMNNKGDTYGQMANFASQFRHGSQDQAAMMSAAQEMAASYPQYAGSIEKLVRSGDVDGLTKMQANLAALQVAAQQRAFEQWKGEQKARAEGMTAQASLNTSNKPIAKKVGEGLFNAQGQRLDQPSTSSFADQHGPVKDTVTSNNIDYNRHEDGAIDYNSGRPTQETFTTNDKGVSNGSLGTTRQPTVVVGDSGLTTPVDQGPVRGGGAPRSAPAAAKPTGGSAPAAPAAGADPSAPHRQTAEDVANNTAILAARTSRSAAENKLMDDEAAAYADAIKTGQGKIQALQQNIDYVKNAMKHPGFDANYGWKGGLAWANSNKDGGDHTENPEEFAVRKWLLGEDGMNAYSILKTGDAKARLSGIPAITAAGGTAPRANAEIMSGGQAQQHFTDHTQSPEGARAGGELWIKSMERQQQLIRDQMTGRAAGYRSPAHYTAQVFNKSEPLNPRIGDRHKGAKSTMEFIGGDVRDPKSWVAVEGEPD